MSSNSQSVQSMFALVSSHTASGSQNTRVSWAGDMNPATNKPRTVSVTIPGHHESVASALLRLMSMPGGAVLRVTGLKSVEGGFTLSAAAPMSPNSLIDLLLAVGVRQGSPLTDPRTNEGKDDEGKPGEVNELERVRAEVKALGLEPGRKGLDSLKRMIADHKASVPDHNANGTVAQPA